MLTSCFPFLVAVFFHSLKFGISRKSCGNTHVWLEFPQHFLFSQTSTCVSVACLKHGTSFLILTYRMLNPLNAKDVYIHPKIRDSDTEDVHIHPPWSFVFFSPVVCVFFPWSFKRVWEVVKSPLTKEFEYGHYMIPMWLC